MVAPLPTPYSSGWLLTYPPSHGNGPVCSMARLSAPRSPGPQPTLLAHGPSCSAALLPPSSVAMTIPMAQMELRERVQRNHSPARGQLFS